MLSSPHEKLGWCQNLIWYSLFLKVPFSTTLATLAFAYSLAEHITFSLKDLLDLERKYRDNITVSHRTKSRHNHQELIIIEIVQSKCPVICLQCTDNESYY